MQAKSRISLLLATLPKILLLMVLFLVAACGLTTGTTGNVGGGPPAGQSSSTPTEAATTSAPAATSTSTVSGIASTSTGCPLPTQVVQWSSPPTVVVMSTQATKEASLQIGQTLELALGFGHRWSLGPATWEPTLALDAPSGYGDASLASCIWRFTAQKAGQITLTFTSAPVCQAHITCPQYQLVLKIPVTVS